MLVHGVYAGMNVSIWGLLLSERFAGWPGPSKRELPKAPAGLRDHLDLLGLIEVRYCPLRDGFGSSNWEGAAMQ